MADGAIAVAGGVIDWVGPAAELDRSQAEGVPVHNAGRSWITPGLIDCHTHIVYGGNRAAEFEQRLNGATYEEIARAGGGIVSTVRATRQASVDALVESALPRIRSLLREGVTTIEIKSGYGLDTATERRMLQAARRIPDHLPVDVATTFLGAHALPPEYAGKRRRLHRSGLRRDDPGGCRGRRGRRRGRVLRIHRLYARTDGAGLPGGARS